MNKSIPSIVAKIATVIVGIILLWFLGILMQMGPGNRTREEFHWNITKYKIFALLATNATYFVTLGIGNAVAIMAD